MYPGACETSIEAMDKLQNQVARQALEINRLTKQVEAFDEEVRTLTKINMDLKNR